MSWAISQMNVCIANNSGVVAMEKDFIAEVAAWHWLMSQGRDQGNVELSKSKILDMMMPVVVQ